MQHGRKLTLVPGQVSQNSGEASLSCSPAPLRTGALRARVWDESLPAPLCTSITVISASTFASFTIMKYLCNDLTF